MGNDTHTDTSLGWRAGPGRNDNVRWLQLLDFFRSNLIVSIYLNIQRRIEFAESLDEIVGKGIVVIDKQNHWIRTAWVSSEFIFSYFNVAARLIEAAIRFEGSFLAFFYDGSSQRYLGRE